MFLGMLQMLQVSEFDATPGWAWEWREIGSGWKGKLFRVDKKSAGQKKLEDAEIQRVDARSMYDEGRSGCVAKKRLDPTETLVFFSMKGAGKKKCVAQQGKKRRNSEEGRDVKL